MHFYTQESHFHSMFENWYLGYYKMKFCSVWPHKLGRLGRNSEYNHVRFSFSPVWNLLLSDVQVLTQTFFFAHYVSRALILFRKEGGLKDLSQMSPLWLFGCDSPVSNKVWNNLNNDMPPSWSPTWLLDSQVPNRDGPFLLAVPPSSTLLYLFILPKDSNSSLPSSIKNH